MTKATATLPETIPVPQNKDECTLAIGAIGRAQRELDRIEADMNDALEQIKTTAGDASEQHQQIIVMNSEGIEIFCVANRKLLTNNGKVKYAKFDTGTVNWRDQPAAVVVRSVKNALKALLKKRSKFAKACQRSTITLDKEHMLKNPAAVKKLNITGLQVRAAGETFNIEPIAEEVAEQ